LSWLTVSSGPTDSIIPSNTANDVREIDLIGNTIHDLPMASLNQSLAANGFPGLNLFNFSRDVLALPNGHYVFLAQMAKAVSNITGYPGTTNVAGDVLVDVDQNYKPDWVWNSFDHLDVNRHPFQFPPDWTHSDALLYSTDDHDLLLSVRNQNWVIKIDYQDATGTGNIVWRLGEGGDFKLVAAWTHRLVLWAARDQLLQSKYQRCVSVGLFDDGNDRQFPPGRHLRRRRRPSVSLLHGSGALGG